MDGAMIAPVLPSAPERQVAAPPDALREVVAIGGGFAGTVVVKRLQRRLPDGWRITLISEESYTTFNPMLAEVVGASIFPDQVVAPLRQILKQGNRGRFIMGRATAIDFSLREVTCATLAGERRIRYEHLVIAVGALPRNDFIPGLPEHALPLKTVGDALEIRNVVLRRLAQIELETDWRKRAALGHFVIIGGGFSGVEVAGELVDFLREARRYYPRVAAEEPRITLVQDIDRLLPELPRSLGEAAAQALTRRGVELRFGVRAERIESDHVELSDRTFLIAGGIITTAGVRSNPLAGESGLTLDRGRIVVEPDMSVGEFGDVWALGDCASVPNAGGGRSSSPTAQFAVRQGRHLADNILRILRGQPTQPFSYRARGMMATVGRLNGVADVFGLQLSGLPAWLLWRAYYLSQLPTLGRKPRVYVEWAWGMFFPADITHFRFARSETHERRDP
jgi:NADH dehydrogenase